MSLIPLFGHDGLRERVRSAVVRGSLPNSLLIEGPRGIGKQRLALWMAQLLLCQSADSERPCGQCQSCHYAAALVHPDLLWFFPRPRKEGDVEPAEVLEDYREAIAERLQRGGLYAPPSGMEGIFIGAVRALVKTASVSPTIGRRKVFVIGDAERMVPQEGTEQAANAFLKLLEEPPADTTIILTSSEPGALLPTIRSRLVALRAQPVGDDAVRQFIRHKDVAGALDAGSLPTSENDRVLLAAGAPGRLLDAAERVAAREQARRILAAATGRLADRHRTAFAQGVSGARGTFADILEELTVLLHDRSRTAVVRRDERAALAASRAIEDVENAKLMASGNVNPQLITAGLLRRLAGLLA